MSVRFALLPKAGVNRVYGASSLSLTQAELRFIADAVLEGLVESSEVTALGGVDYIVFATTRALTDEDIAVLSNVSALHALFEIEDGRLRPADVVRHELWDDDLLTIQRYSGKTNEQFTRLLANVTLAAAGDSFDRMLRLEPVHLLDPLAGRGTTLNIGVLQGLETAGIELAKRDFEAYREFILRWLKDKRIKHDVDQEVHRKGRDAPVRRMRIRYWPKNEPDRPKRTIEVVNDDTLHVFDSFKRRSFDVIVTDLPYGVQHSSQGTAARDRRPEQLLEHALPVWAELLRPGGAIGLSWNRKTMARAKLLDAMSAVGLSPVTHGHDDAFCHVVDRSITRDLVVARRTDG